jgi:hypothetical protein
MCGSIKADFSVAFPLSLRGFPAMTLGHTLLLLAAIRGLAVVALSPISVKGTKLYDDEGNQFFMKGNVRKSMP